MKEIGKKLSAGILFNKIVDSDTFTSNLQIETAFGSARGEDFEENPSCRVKLHAVCIKLGMFCVKLQEVCVERDGFGVETYSY
jgi:hypothetical protein